MKKILVIGMLVSVLICGCKSKAEVAFDEFISNQTKESFLVLPLCSAGESVVPVVMRNIKNKKLERRGYAIYFLGTTESKSSIPILQTILEDNTEMIGDRAISLKSIYLIDEEVGKNLAIKYKNKSDYLDEVANEIIEVKNHSVYKRQYKELICSPND